MPKTTNPDEKRFDFTMLKDTRSNSRVLTAENHAHALRTIELDMKNFKKLMAFFIKKENGGKKLELKRTVEGRTETLERSDCSSLFSQIRKNAVMVGKFSSVIKKQKAEAKSGESAKGGAIKGLIFVGDNIRDFFCNTNLGNGLADRLVETTVDPDTGKVKRSAKAFIERANREGAVTSMEEIISLLGYHYPGASNIASAEIAPNLYDDEGNEKVFTLNDDGTVSEKDSTVVRIVEIYNCYADDDKQITVAQAATMACPQTTPVYLEGEKSYSLADMFFVQAGSDIVNLGMTQAPPADESSLRNHIFSLASTPMQDGIAETTVGVISPICVAPIISLSTCANWLAHPNAPSFYRANLIEPYFCGTDKNYPPGKTVAFMLNGKNITPEEDFDVEGNKLTDSEKATLMAAQDSVQNPKTPMQRLIDSNSINFKKNAEARAEAGTKSKNEPKNPMDCYVPSMKPRKNENGEEYSGFTYTLILAMGHKVKSIPAIFNDETRAMLKDETMKALVDASRKHISEIAAAYKAYAPKVAKVSKPAEPAAPRKKKATASPKSTNGPVIKTPSKTTRPMSPSKSSSPKTEASTKASAKPSGKPAALPTGKVPSKKPSTTSPAKGKKN